MISRIVYARGRAIDLQRRAALISAALRDDMNRGDPMIYLAGRQAQLSWLYRQARHWSHTMLSAQQRAARIGDDSS